MFLTELIKLYRELPDITENNISCIDNFFGELRTDELFSKDDLMYEISQKLMINEILDFLIKHKIIAPYLQICDMCKYEQSYENTECESCNSLLQNSKNVSYYKLISEIKVPYSLSEFNENKKRLIDISSFKILMKKIEQKKRNNTKATIVLIDIANSVELSKNDKYLSTLVNSKSIKYTKEIMNKYFNQSKGILFKNDGDSSFIYFNEKQDAHDFLLDFKYSLSDNDYTQKIEEYNLNNKRPIYYKIFVAESEVLEFIQKDITSLDFSNLEAIAFISRIEKLSKPEIIKDVGDEKLLYPFFIAYRDNFYSNKKIHLDNVPNYGNIEIYYSLNNELA